jgi:branched-chain amino acid transport system substrate-binding protein
MQGTFFTVVRGAAYLFVVLAIGFGAYQLIVISDENPAHHASIYYSAPLSLLSTDISRNSVLLALEENEYSAGDIELSLVIMDGGDESGAWDSKKERVNAHRAADDPTAVAYIGPLNSGAAKISMPILNEAGIAQISPSNTWPGLTKPGFLPGEPAIFYPTGERHYVRVAPTDDMQGPAGARWAYALGYRDVYVVNDSDAYGVGIADLFVNEARNLGMNVIGYSSISTDPQSYKRIGDVIASSSVSLVYYGGLTPHGGPELLSYIREKGSTARFMGADGVFEYDFIARAGSAAEGALITSIGIAPSEAQSPTARAYLEAYRTRFGSEPDVFGALAYDATRAVVSAIERANSVDREAVRDALLSMGSQPGVFSTWGFDENGDTTLTLMSGYEVRDGAFVFEKILSQ